MTCEPKHKQKLTREEIAAFVERADQDGMLGALYSAMKRKEARVLPDKSRAEGHE